MAERPNCGKYPKEKKGEKKREGEGEGEREGEGEGEGRRHLSHMNREQGKNQVTQRSKRV